MNTKFKLLITLATGMYFFTSCNDSATTTDKENIDTTAMSSMPNDTMNKKMDMDTINNSDNSQTGAMNSSMAKMENMQMTGDFDLDFANMLIEHHQGAIDMSKIEVEKGADEKM